MIQIGIAVVALIVLVVMSLRANTRFRHERSLPMQWSLKGEVNWSAPRLVALSFMPVLAAVTLTAVVTLSMFSEPRAGQAHLVVPVFVLMAGTLVAVHAFHLWLIARTVGANQR